MNMKQIREIGKKKGVKIPVTMKKVEAIRMIQRAEGNFDCFGKAFSGYCDQESCLWRDDCLTITQPL
jgi:hypothetical protein